MSEEEPPYTVELIEGYWITRRPDGEIEVVAEPWARALDPEGIRSLADARLSTCRAALELVEQGLGGSLPRGKQDELLDQYGVLLKDRRLLEDFLASA